MNHLGLFAKFWQPGTVKTRLAATIGNVKACNLYQTFVFHLLTRLENSADQRSVVFTPLSKESEFQASVPHTWGFQPQHDGDLGKRMGGFFGDCFQQKSDTEDQDSTGLDQDSEVLITRRPSLERSDKVVVIGADCPLVSSETINAAFRQLDEVPVVFGPSLDGGYYLLGMRQNYEDIFSNVSWSTEHVLQQSIGNLEKAKIQYSLLNPMIDIDELDDLMNLKMSLEQKFEELDSLDRKLLQQIELATGEVETVESTRDPKATKQ